jgi:hypothetical protein
MTKATPTSRVFTNFLILPTLAIVAAGNLMPANIGDHQTVDAENDRQTKRNCL